MPQQVHVVIAALPSSDSTYYPLQKLAGPELAWNISAADPANSRPMETCPRAAACRACIGAFFLFFVRPPWEGACLANELAHMVAATQQPREVGVAPASKRGHVRSSLRPLVRSQDLDPGHRRHRRAPTAWLGGPRSRESFGSYLALLNRAVSTKPVSRFQISPARFGKARKARFQFDFCIGNALQTHRHLPSVFPHTSVFAPLPRPVPPLLSAALESFFFCHEILFVSPPDCDSRVAATHRHRTIVFHRETSSALSLPAANY
jgi:hypothetical protein